MGIGKHAYSTYSKYIYLVIFPNIITYYNRTFKEEKNDMDFKMIKFV